MRKSLIIPALFAFAVLSLSSCEKEKQEETTLEQTFDRTLKVNESITFTLPTSTSEQEYKITTDASHAYVSKLSEDIEGNSIYCYTPEKDFNGTDLVVVSSLNEKSKSGHHKSPRGFGSKGGHCKGSKNSKQQIVVTLNLTIVKDNVTTSTPITATEGAY